MYIDNENFEKWMEKLSKKLILILILYSMKTKGCWIIKT